MKDYLEDLYQNYLIHKIEGYKFHNSTFLLHTFLQLLLYKCLDIIFCFVRLLVMVLFWLFWDNQSTSYEFLDFMVTTKLLSWLVKIGTFFSICHFTALKPTLNHFIVGTLLLQGAGSKGMRKCMPKMGETANSNRG